MPSTTKNAAKAKRPSSNPRSTSIADVTLTRCARGPAGGRGAERASRPRGGGGPEAASGRERGAPPEREKERVRPRSGGQPHDPAAARVPRGARGKARPADQRGCEHELEQKD